MTGAMAREIGESAAVARAAIAGHDAVARAAAFLDFPRAPLAVVCGRGSSGHAGVHLRYLIEAKLGLPVSASAPSIASALGCDLRLEGVPFVVISQSGRSPDLVAATRAARRAGARTLAIVNDPDSPVAGAAERVLAIGAGRESAVAATKSVIGSLAVASRLVAAAASDAALLAALDRLPDRLAQAQRLNWHAFGVALAKARCVFVTGRGYALGPAREIALKIAETLRVPALAYGAAELLHGPRAAVAADTPVLALRLADGTAQSVDALVEGLRATGIEPSVCGGPGALAWIGDDHPAVDAIAMLVPAYRTTEAASRAAGYDPDNPPHLKKITETL